MSDGKVDESNERRLDSACWNELLRLFGEGKFARARELLESNGFAFRIARVLFVDLDLVIAKLVIDQLAYEGWAETTAAARGSEPRRTRSKKRGKGFDAVPIADFARLGGAGTRFRTSLGGEVGSRGFGEAFAGYEPIGSTAPSLHDRLRVLREILHGVHRHAPGKVGDQVAELARRELAAFGVWLGSPGAGRPAGSSDRPDRPRKTRARRPDVVESVTAVDDEVRRAPAEISQAAVIRDKARRMGEPAARIKRRLYDDPLFRKKRTGKPRPE